MVLTEFPDLTWLKKQAEDSFSNRQAWGGHSLPSTGWPTVILNVETSRICRDNIRGPLSIFTNLSGDSEVETGNRKVKIREGYFFVTNHDQHYTLSVGQTRATTCNIHFGEYFADEVIHTLSTHPSQLLDQDTFIAPFEKTGFYNRIHARPHELTKLLQEITQADNKLLLDEKLYQVLGLLLADNRSIKKMAAQLPALKNSTKDEITRRLLLAVDYIYTFYDQDIQLETLAGISCISKFHFLRLFKIAFGKTPHQFIIDIKVAKGKELLKRTPLEVTSIAHSLGFKNASSFSRLFYQQVGLYPSQYR